MEIPNIVGIIGGFALYVLVSFIILRFIKQYLGFETLQREAQAQTFLLMSIAEKIGVDKEDIATPAKLSNGE